ncbi:hypothetical protein BgiMline_022526 [Biomphalaria glabrata]
MTFLTPLSNLIPGHLCVCCRSFRSGLVLRHVPTTTPAPWGVSASGSSSRALHYHHRHHRRPYQLSVCLETAILQACIMIISEAAPSGSELSIFYTFRGGAYFIHSEVEHILYIFFDQARCGITSLDLIPTSAPARPPTDTNTIIEMESHGPHQAVSR